MKTLALALGLALVCGSAEAQTYGEPISGNAQFSTTFHIIRVINCDEMVTRCGGFTPPDCAERRQWLALEQQAFKDAFLAVDRAGDRQSAVTDFKSDDMQIIRLYIATDLLLTDARERLERECGDGLK